MIFRADKKQGALRNSSSFSYNSSLDIKGKKKKHTMLLHNFKELDDNLGRGSQESLSLSSLLGIVDGSKSVSKNRGTSHLVYNKMLVSNIYLNKSMFLFAIESKYECPKNFLMDS